MVEVAGEQKHMLKGKGLNALGRRQILGGKTRDGGPGFSRKKFSKKNKSGMMETFKTRNLGLCRPLCVALGPAFLLEGYRGETELSRFFNYGHDPSAGLRPGGLCALLWK